MDGCGDGVKVEEPDLDGAMDRYARGDDAAFELVHDALRPRLVRYLRRQLADPEVAEELVQEAFFHMIDARSRFIPGARVLPWAYAIARGLLIDWLRRARTRRSYVTREELVPQRVATPLELAEAAQTARSLDDKLRAMPETHREVFRLLKQDGLSLEQAAETLGTTVTAIKLRSHRAYAALRAAIDAGED